MRKQTPPKPRMEWDSPISDYSLFSAEACKLLLEQARSYLDETIEESQELTARGTKMLFLLLPAIAGVAGYCISNQEKFHHIRGLDIFLLATSLLLAGYCLFQLFVLINPKNIHYRGAKPEETLRQEFLWLSGAYEIEKALFISELERYQIKIEQMEHWNYKRIFIYRRVIASFNLMLLFGIILLYRVI